MNFAIIWFILWGVLWTVYFVLDGFDLGAGMLQPFIARDESERHAVAASIGPFWNGNEVWLLTAGGATFAAFPTAYAVMFSSLYSALLLVLFALIARGVALELRNKEPGAAWRRAWDSAFFTGSAAAALLFGVAFGNIFSGLPLDAAGYHGSLLGLLNPYGLLTGVLFVLLFLVHGALWLAIKTAGALSSRAAVAAKGLWLALVPVAVAFLAATAYATKLYDNYLAHPALFLVPLLAVAGLLGSRLASGLKAFLCSGLTIAMVTATGIIGLFPNLLPSSLDPAYSVTIANAASSPYTLKIMTVVALCFVPVVICYQLWSYRVLRQAVDPSRPSAQDEAY